MYHLLVPLFNFQAPDFVELDLERTIGVPKVSHYQREIELAKKGRRCRGGFQMYLVGIDVLLNSKSVVRLQTFKGARRWKGGN
jgi:hypothetical protein